MKRKLSPLGSMIAVIVALSLVILMLVAVMPAFPVSGSGTVTIDIPISGELSGSVRHEVPGGTSEGVTYSALRNSGGTDNASYFVNTPALYSSFQTNNMFRIMERKILTFDVSSVNVTSYEEILDGSIFMRWHYKVNNFTSGTTFAWSLYEMGAGYTPDDAVVATDFSFAKPYTTTRVSSEIAGVDEYSVNTTIEFPIMDFSTIFDPVTQTVTVSYAESIHDSTGAQPDWESFKDVICQISSEYLVPYLSLTVGEATLDRIIVTDGNAATDNDTTGDEVADNITWQSPRAGYADEGLLFWVNGESGAVITLELQDENGVVLDAENDSIRVDGKYEYNPDLPNSWYGWVRLLETTHNLTSDWGYQMPIPSTDQAGNTVYAVNTEYPQYEFAFTRYLTYENDAFVLHWKTNIQSDEHADHDLRMWTNTDNLTPIFDHDFEWLNDNYFNANDNNSYLSHWRYMIYTPNIDGSGFEDYDGMIYDLDTNYTSSVAGYIHAVVVDTTDNSTLADSHSCYWYIPKEPDGIITRLSAVQVAKGGEFIAYVQVGQACQAGDTLPNLNLKIIDESDSVISQSSESFIESELNEYVLTAPTISGRYVVRFTFSGVDTWDYIHDIPFDVGPARALTGADSIIDSLEQWIVNAGLDNPVGYWVILLVGMVLLFLVAYKVPILRVVLPLVFLGLMMIWGKVDTWLIVLLALGAGLTVWGIFRRKAHGGGGGEGDG